MDCDSYFQNTEISIESLLELAHVEWWINKKGSLTDGEEEEEELLLRLITDPKLLHEQLQVPDEEKAAVKV